MINKYSLVGILALLVIVAGCAGGGEEPTNETASRESTPEVTEPTPDEKVVELEQMCAGVAEAISARQAESSLYDRVGGREGLHTVVADTVQRHQVNEQIKHLLDEVDTDHLISQVTDFLVVATGGEGEYTGRDMHEAHAHMALTNADFLAAGSDLGAAMESAGWGENEQQELLCAFVSLRGEVVAE